MIISNFQKYIKNGKTRVECVIDNVNKVLLECAPEYINYVQDTYDGFLVLMLCVAMKENKNIEIKGKLSYKLYYNIVHHVMPIIRILHPSFYMIQIKVKEFTEEKYDAWGNGCGLSCGIDSLACIEDYYFKNCRSYKLTHLTNFFAGATKNRQVYENKLINIQNYIDETDLSFLQVYTNFHKANNLEHQYFHTLRNLSVPLFFQKLFKRYYYSSSFAFQNSKIVPGSGSITSAEPIIIPLLSTETLELSIHGAQYSRLRKTEMVSKNPLSYKYLDVCVHPQYYETIKDRINCSKCFKCLRTCCTLDYYCALDKYTDVFDIEIYQKYKESFLLDLQMTNPYDRELKSRYYYEDKLYLDIKYNIDFEDLIKNMLFENELILNHEEEDNNHEEENNNHEEENNNHEEEDNNHEEENNNHEEENNNHEEENNNHEEENNNHEEENNREENNNNISNNCEEIPSNINFTINYTQNLNEEELNYLTNINSNNHKIKSVPVEIKHVEHIEVDRYWWAFKKDWDFLKNANQIKSIKETIVKKHKNIHSSQLKEHEKQKYKKGKLFKLEKKQNDNLYYKIFI